MNKDRYQSTSARRALALLNSPMDTSTNARHTIVPTKSDSDILFTIAEYIVYNDTHKILTCVLHVRRYCSVVVMSTALDAGVPGSNLFRGLFFSSYFTRPKSNRRLYFSFCKLGSFREVLFSRNFSHAKFRENKIIVKWRNNSVVYLP